MRDDETSIRNVSHHHHHHYVGLATNERQEIKAKIYCRRRLPFRLQSTTQ